MRKTLILLFVVCYTFKLISQTTEIVPFTTTVANASVADSKSYTAFKNPASLGSTSTTNLGIQYENKYLLKELSTKSIYFSSATKLMNIALCTSYYGYEQYNELLCGIALSRNFNNTFNLGVQYNYYSVYYAESNNRYGSFFPQVGLQVKLSSEFQLGFSTFNPLQQSIKTEHLEKRIPSVFSLGCNWKISENFDFLFQTDKNISGNYKVAGGFEYEIKDFLIVKTGAYHNEFLVSTIGFGFKMGKAMFHLNAELHPKLGLCTLASLNYCLSKQ
ncbi:MAG: hypothetical protein ACOYM7_01335 [Paludibacter sp.]